MDFNTSFSTKSPQETAQVAQELGYYLVKSKESRVKSEKAGSAKATIVCLYGELGSGKTTFAGGFAKALGVNTRLLSPTFIIVRRYPLLKKLGFLYHIDLYRTEGEKDLTGLGLSEILFDPDSIVLVEWAEKLGDLLPKKRWDIHLSLGDESTHIININYRQPNAL